MRNSVAKRNRGMPRFGVAKIHMETDHFLIRKSLNQPGYLNMDFKLAGLILYAPCPYWFLVFSGHWPRNQGHSGVHPTIFSHFKRHT